MPGWKKDGLNGRGSDDIKCPYWHAHNNREILCESHIPDSRIVFKFDSDKKKKIQQRIFCEGCYERCEHYITVTHFKWPEDK